MDKKTGNVLATGIDFKYSADEWVVTGASLTNLLDQIGEQKDQKVLENNLRPKMENAFAQGEEFAKIVEAQSDPEYTDPEDPTGEGNK